MSDRILVTGATGFLGGTLTRHLHKIGADVVATGRNAARLPAFCRGFASDLSQPPSEPLIKACAGVTTIVHCAALSSPWGRHADFHRDNVQTTETVIRLARTLGAAHLVFISSPSVYFRFEDQFNIGEDAPLPPPVNAYAATKAIAEARIKASGIPYTILRPRGIYGDGDTTLLPRLLRAAQSGPMPLLRDGNVRTDITHVDDVVAAIMAVITQDEAAQGQIFNVSGGTALAIKDVVTQVCVLQNVPLRWRPLPLRPAFAAVRLLEGVARMRPGRPEPRVTAYGLGIFAFSQTMDISKINRRLGWAPEISFEQGLARTFAPKDAA